MVMNILTELGRRTGEHIKNFNRKTNKQTSKQKQENQTEVTELKNTTKLKKQTNKQKNTEGG